MQSQEQMMRKLKQLKQKQQRQINAARIEMQRKLNQVAQNCDNRQIGMVLKMSVLTAQHDDLSRKQIQMVIDQHERQQAEYEALQRQNIRMQQKLKANKNLNPTKMQDVMKDQLDMYRENLQDMVQEQSDTKQVIVTGSISSAKSSTLNFHLGLNLKTGIDDTSSKKDMVKQYKNVRVWDTPGISEQNFNLMQIENARWISRAHRVFFCFNVSLKTNKNSVLILASARKGKQFYCVRTMCDKFENPEQLQKALQTDRKILAQWGLGQEIPVLATSNRYFMQFGQNQVLNDLLRRQQNLL